MQTLFNIGVAFGITLCVLCASVVYFIHKFLF